VEGASGSVVRVGSRIGGLALHNEEAATVAVKYQPGITLLYRADKRDGGRGGIGVMKPGGGGKFV